MWNAHLYHGGLYYNVLHYTSSSRKREQMPVSDAQKRAKRRYDLTTKELVLRFRLNKDGDVIQRLSEVPNKTEYIRSLVRQDIKDG